MKRMIRVLNAGMFMWALGVFVSCATANREDLSVATEVPAAPTHALLEKQVNATELTPEMLKAFELKAVSKLEEYYEYFQIISDQEQDTTFRRQAIAQVLALVSDEAVIPYTGLGDLYGSLPIFLEDIYAGKWEKVRYEVSQVVLKKPLVRIADDTYTGQVAYYLQLNDQHLLQEPALQDIVVKKVATTFGPDVVRVWKVFLGK